MKEAGLAATLKPLAGRMRLVMNRKQTLWLTSAVWGAGFLVSGAFAFAMNQPLQHYDWNPSPTPIAHVAEHETVVRTPSPTTAALAFDAVELTVPRSHLFAAPVAPKVDAAPAFRDLDQMNCSAPRALEQGGNTVRECQ